MRVRFEISIDLGSEGTEHDKRRDIDTLALALKEACVWHGAVRRISAREEVLFTRVADREAWTTGDVIDLRADLVEGVEWGGK